MAEVCELSNAEEAAREKAHGGRQPRLSSTQNGPPQTHDNLCLSFSNAKQSRTSSKCKEQRWIKDSKAIKWRLQGQPGYNMIPWLIKRVSNEQIQIHGRLTLQEEAELYGRDGRTANSWGNELSRRELCYKSKHSEVSLIRMQARKMARSQAAKESKGHT